MSDSSVIYLGEKNHENDLKFQGMVNEFLQKNKEWLATELATEKFATDYWIKANDEAYKMLDDCSATLEAQENALIHARGQLLSIKERDKQTLEFLNHLEKEMRERGKIEEKRMAEAIERRDAAAKYEEESKELVADLIDQAATTFGPKGYGAKGGKNRYSQERALAIELAHKFLGSRNQKPSRAETARAILEDVKKAARTRGQPLSDSQAINTVDGWLKENFSPACFKERPPA